jgi:hypothetical protein
MKQQCIHCGLAIPRKRCYAAGHTWCEPKLGWEWRKQQEGHWDLIAPSGKMAATVWPNGTWHTWDEDGTGGQNSVERGEHRMGEAKRQAWASLWEQQWHGLVAPIGHPVSGDGGIGC